MEHEIRENKVNRFKLNDDFIICKSKVFYDFVSMLFFLYLIMSNASGTLWRVKLLVF